MTNRLLWLSLLTIRVPSFSHFTLCGEDDKLKSEEVGLLLYLQAQIVQADTQPLSAKKFLLMHSKIESQFFIYRREL